MSKKKTYSEVEKQELLKVFGKLLDDQSLRIIEAFKNGGKDVNSMLVKAWNFKKLI
jgi:hypothetical protein